MKNSSFLLSTPFSSAYPQNRPRLQAKKRKRKKKFKSPRLPAWLVALGVRALQHGRPRL